jgi:hypothetical protein
VITPISAMDFARSVRDLADHEQQMLPHLVSDSTSFGVGQVREGIAEVVVNDRSAQPDDVIE